MPHAASIAFVMPRADWIESNLPLLRRLSQDEDVAVSLVAPADYRPPAGCDRIALHSYPFYEDPPRNGGTLRRAAALFRDGRARRARIERILSASRPDLVVVVSTSSRELVPFVRLGRARGARVALLQSVFLAPGLRDHVRRENRRLLDRRPLRTLGSLLGRRAVSAAAGMPGLVFKPDGISADADVVFAINQAQSDVFQESMASDRIVVTGTPLLDHLHVTISELPRRTSRAALDQALALPQNAPLALYVSKSLEQFCQADPAVEREAQRFYVSTFLERFPDAVLIVKLHPIESDRAFVDVAAHRRVRVVKQWDIHELLHHAALVISLGTSTPALHAVFHRRPRLIIERVGEIELNYQRPLLDASATVARREEYVAALDELSRAGWPETVPARFRGRADAVAAFLEGFDGRATERVRNQLRHLLGLTA